MEPKLIYFLQASIGIVLFYLLYFFLLKNETFYSANRCFLLAAIGLSLILPLFPISYVSDIALVKNSDFFSLSENPVMMKMGNNLEIQEEAGFWINFSQLLLWIYFMGVTFFLFRLTWQTGWILWKIWHSTFEFMDGIKIINQPTTVPFSFFNVVFIDIQKYSERELSNIIAHEKVHILERHWIDLLIIEVMTVLFWINPVVWLYEKSIKQNHEYLADQGVLLAGYSPGQYQALLINQLMGVKVLGFAHNLNFSLNKKRMEMMKKKKSPGVSKMKLLLVLPIIALLVFAFAKKEYVMIDTVENNLQSTDIQTEDLVRVSGMVQNSNSEPLAGINIIVKGTTTGTISNQGGQFIIEAPEEATLVFSYIGYENQMQKLSELDKSNAIIIMKEGVFNIKLPDINDKIVVNAPPPPPVKISNKKISEVVEEMPSYKDPGMYMLAQDINKMTSSVTAITKDRGEVIVGFTVTEIGMVVNTHIVESSNSKTLDTSALEIVQKLDNWNPGIQGGKAVKVNLTVPVKFQ